MIQIGTTKVESPEDINTVIEVSQWFLLRAKEMTKYPCNLFFQEDHIHVSFIDYGPDAGATGKRHEYLVPFHIWFSQDSLARWMKTQSGY